MQQKFLDVNEWWLTVKKAQKAFQTLNLICKYFILSTMKRFLRNLFMLNVIWLDEVGSEKKRFSFPHKNSIHSKISFKFESHFQIFSSGISS